MSSNGLTEVQLKRLSTLVRRGLQEASDLELELSWSDADPGLLAIATKVAALWQGLSDLIAKPSRDQAA